MYGTAVWNDEGEEPMVVPKQCNGRDGETRRQITSSLLICILVLIEGAVVRKQGCYSIGKILEKTGVPLILIY
jgi:hypothetical protein